MDYRKCLLWCGGAAMVALILFAGAFVLSVFTALFSWIG